MLTHAKGFIWPFEQQILYIEIYTGVFQSLWYVLTMYYVEQSTKDVYYLHV